MLALLSKKRTIIATLLGGLSIILLPLWVQGEAQQKESAISFSYQNNIPKNQITEGNFFDLLVKPEAKQTLVTEVSNDSQKDIVVKVTINDAKTTERGLIEYGPNKLDGVEKSQLKLTDIFEGPSEIRLKKGEVKKVEFKLTMPKKEFKGVLLGGIQLQEVKKKEVAQENTTLKNEYAYIFSVSIRETKEKADLAFSHKRSYYEKNLNGEEVKVLINNESQEIAKKIQLDSRIISVETDEVVSDIKYEDIKMAPMSVMAVTLPYPNAKVGKYKAYSVITIKEEKWEFEREFEIKNKDLTGENIQAVTVDEKNNWLPVVIIGLIIVVGTAVLYSVIRQVKR